MSVGIAVGLPRASSGAGSSARLGLQVEQVDGELGARHAVDGGVVGLGDRGDEPVLEALDHVHLPQRPACGRAGRLMTSAANSASSSVAARRGQRGPAHVVVEVEVGVLDPQRVVELERDLDEPAPERRQQGQAVLHQLASPCRTSSPRARSTGRTPPSTPRACGCSASRGRGRSRRGRTVVACQPSRPILTDRHSRPTSSKLGTAAGRPAACRRSGTWRSTAATWWRTTTSRTVSPHSGHVSPLRPWTRMPALLLGFSPPPAAPPTARPRPRSTRRSAACSARDLLGGELARRLERRQLGQVQGVVGVGVADAGDHPLVGEHAS